MMADTAALPWLRPGLGGASSARGPAGVGRRAGRSRPTPSGSTRPVSATSSRPWRARDDLAGRGRSATPDVALAGLRRRDRPRPPRSPGATTPRASGTAAADLVGRHGPPARPGHPRRAGRRHVHPGLQRRPARADRAERPALRRARSCSGSQTTQPGTGRRRHSAPQSLEPGERTTLQVPTEVRQSGGFAVTAELTTPGRQLARRARSRCRSRAPRTARSR